MIYEYVNAKGERNSIVSSEEPPEKVIFLKDRTDIFETGGRWLSACPLPMFAWIGKPDVYVRDRSEEAKNAANRVPAMQVPQHGITYAGVPASRSLPRRKGGKLDKLHGHDVKRHKDGGYTTLDGRPIVQGKQDAQREMKRTDMMRED